MTYAPVPTHLRALTPTTSNINGINTAQDFFMCGIQLIDKKIIQRYYELAKGGLGRENEMRTLATNIKSELFKSTLFACIDTLQGQYDTFRNDLYPQEMNLRQFKYGDLTASILFPKIFQLDIDGVGFYFFDSLFLLFFCLIILFHTFTVAFE